ncbi:hypothetical protein [Streptomyces sp. NPDC059786]|uniref:hypothetical protein n=1 Tax=Streptomyces sp. NPDC059786 TaxID=3346946 RepID=UPI003666A087
MLTPAATRRQRLALRWLTRRPARSIPLLPFIRLSAAVAALISLATVLFAMAHGIPATVALPAMLLAPLLAEHLPGRLDARARAHVRSVEGAAACRYLQRLTAWYTRLAQAVADGGLPELQRSVRTGHHLLWDAAGLLQDHDTRTVSAQLIDHERLMIQLVDQAVPSKRRTTAQAHPADTEQPRGHDRPLGPYPPGSQQTTATAQCAYGTSPKEDPPMPSPHWSDHAVHTADVYLLFAHEPYYPGPDTQEINTTLVAAASLLHPDIRQPDGVRIHDLLTRERQPGEIVPLATLTHELNGGAGWPALGNWEDVTAGLLRLVRAGGCDALSLGLTEIARALVCTGPHSHVRTYDTAAGESIAYGPAERAAVLDQIATFLAGLVAELRLWPGDNLLPPLSWRV